MAVSRQATRPEAPARSSPRQRMKRTLLDSAMTLMQSGLIPSVSEVAEAAGVSRATAYRYFPSQAAMIQEAVDEALGPILEWDSESDDAEARIADLIAFAYPRMEGHEATLRGALRLALDQWSRRQAGTLGEEAPIVRGNRVRLLRSAVAPLQGELGARTIDNLTQSLSLIFGTEAFVVLKDIWGLDGVEARRVAVWAAHALVRGARAEAAAKPRIAPAAGGRQEGERKAARRPRNKR